ncbi:hypothetical protein ODI84_07835 [Pseudomonas putida]|uniref:hypothetical protein n=1 Tax=Pseudomonas putida TaxID=303 RepID=UPI002D1F13CA|nr:hypothetical protein [Pseudomonas putida]MEB3900089.1 hypothetical protein [Pseudomonas putida]
MSAGSFWVIAFFVFINNGCSLLGCGDRSVGAVARGIESRTEIANAITLQRAQKANAGGQPPERGQEPSTIFLTFRA